MMQYTPPTSPHSLTTTLFIGDLPLLCNELSVRELFTGYGDIERVQLKKSDRDPQRAHLGFGFVKFTKRECAQRALDELNGRFFMGRALRVGWAEDHHRTGGVVKAMDPKKNHQTAQLHVSFMTRDLNRRVSEMDLGMIFNSFGNVVDIAIKKNVLNTETGVQSGYAFVHFSLNLAGLQSALTASEQVTNRIFDNVTYKCKTDEALIMQYLAFKSPTPESPRSRSSSADLRDPLSFSSTDSDYSSLDRRPKSVSYTLNFSTYGKTAEPQIVYTSYPQCEAYVEAEQFYHSISRSSSSMKENDYRYPRVCPSMSLSASFDEYPSYRRGVAMNTY